MPSYQVQRDGSLNDNVGCVTNRVANLSIMTLSLKKKKDKPYVLLNAQQVDKLSSSKSSALQGCGEDEFVG